MSSSSTKARPEPARQGFPFSSLRAMRPAAPARAEVFAGLTQEELEAAFALVKPANWKDPIEARLYLSDEEVRRLIAAVPYFTGGPVFLLPVAGFDGVYKRADGGVERVLYRASAAGYYACIGA